MLHIQVRALRVKIAGRESAGAGKAPRELAQRCLTQRANSPPRTGERGVAAPSGDCFSPLVARNFRARLIAQMGMESPDNRRKADDSYRARPRR